MNDNTRFNLVLFFIGLIFVIWIALLIAPVCNQGLIKIISEFSQLLENPFEIVWCDNSIKIISLFLILYAFIIVYFVYSKKNYRHRI